MQCGLFVGRGFGGSSAHCIRETLAQLAATDKTGYRRGGGGGVDFETLPPSRPLFIFFSF